MQVTKENDKDLTVTMTGEELKRLMQDLQDYVYNDIESGERYLIERGKALDVIEDRRGTTNIRLYL